jgi:phosphoribosylformylglycinamidine synthase|tara:strand:- start:277 stop:534 length:258 start_codon:yes stop_codon:yes gene_type:complete
MQVKATIYISLKPSVSDPQGLTVAQGLTQLGFKGIKSVKIGKHIEVTLNVSSIKQAKVDVTKMCLDLLSNPIIEDYNFDLTVINQ